MKMTRLIWWASDRCGVCPRVQRRAAARDRGAATVRHGERRRRRSSAASSPAPKGPEAGVWVIAETTDLPTKFAKIVVTDDRGRYLMPDLPKANYDVWVRGYGLVDSAKVTAAPGKTLEPHRGRRAEPARGRASTIRRATGFR